MAKKTDTSQKELVKQTNMTHHDIVKKLIGRINPVGETNTDNERFENLQAMTDLVESLLLDIHAVAVNNIGSHEFSVKRAADFAQKFLANRIGVE